MTASVTLGRPAPRPWHAVTLLEDFALVTWTADPDAVAALLPTGFEPQLVTVGTETAAAVSLVAFMEHDFRFRGLPFARLTCGQIDYRTYVTRGDDSGVLFLGTTLDSALAAAPRILWSMAIRTAPVTIDAIWNGRTLDHVHVAAHDVDHGAELRLRGDPDASIPPALLRHELTDPLTGWYTRRNGRVAAMSVWHDELELQPARVEQATSTLLTRLGLIDDGQLPVAALVTPHVKFDVHTPPRIA